MDEVSFRRSKENLPDDTLDTSNLRSSVDNNKWWRLRRMNIRWIIYTVVEGELL